MWPWGHFAVGFLCYRGWCAVRGTTPSHGRALVVLAVATQLPDLVDKPLAWELGFLVSGRSLGHSLLVGLPILLVLWHLLADRRHYWVAFTIGYLSHLAGDGIQPLLAGEYTFLTYLVWPLFGTPYGGVDVGIIEYLLTPELTASYLGQWGLFLLAIVVWAVDGFPGLELLRPSAWRSVPEE
jgi:hypothetical protein